MEHEFKPFDKVLARHDPMQRWEACIYQSKAADNTHKVIGKHFPVRLCIPYCGNEYLCGTTVTPVVHDQKQPEVANADNPYSFGDFVDIKYGGVWLHCVYLSRQKDGSHRVATKGSLYTDVFDDEIKRTEQPQAAQHKYQYGDKVEITDVHMESWNEALYLSGSEDGKGHSVHSKKDNMILWVPGSRIRPSEKNSKSEYEKQEGQKKRYPGYQWGDMVEVLCGGTKWTRAIYVSSRCDSEVWQHEVIVDGEICSVVYDDDEVRPMAMKS